MEFNEHANCSNSSTATDDSLAKQFYAPVANVSIKNGSESVLLLRKTYKELQSNPIPSDFKPKLDGPSKAWKVFKRLSLASSFANSAFAKDCMIFSFEERYTDNSGQRLFLVTHPEHLWINYKSRQPEERCTYEVIREGFPCKLYFDLEFDRVANPTIDGNSLTKIFIKCIIAEMIGIYDIHLQESNFLWLDASTDYKFSSHLIVQMPHAVFQNNIVAGTFVSSLLFKIMSRIANGTDDDGLWPSCSELKSLIILKADCKKSFFCDSGVYTKNRNSRLYLSTKYGKRAPLVVSQCNQYIPAKDDRLSLQESMFYDSLITYFRNKKKMRILTSSESIVPDSHPNPSFPVKIKNISGQNKCISEQSNRGLSPFPEIDNFVLSLVRDPLAIGFIRKWSYIEKEELLVYEIGNYRYCSNINRHHKSNNIMLIVDLKKKNYYQKCHDPECRAENYKSNVLPLPSSLYLPDEFFEMECFTQLCTEPQDSTPSSKECKNESVTNDYDEMTIEDSFFDDTFPFTQMNDINNSCTTKECKQAESCDKLSEDLSLFADVNFDDVSTEGFDRESRNKDTDQDLTDTASRSKTLRENDLDEMSSPDSISAEDEIAMAEAAAILECSITDADFLSEETIF